MHYQAKWSVPYLHSQLRQSLQYNRFCNQFTNPTSHQKTKNQNNSQQKNMDQKIIYAIVIETDGKVVGEHDITKNSNLRETVVNTIYPRVPKNNHRRTLKHNASDFHYKCSDNRCYFAVADSNFKQRSVWAFLDEVEKEYLRISLAPNPTAVKKILKKQMVCFKLVILFVVAKLLTK